jgi:hypothetical protein
MSAVAGGASGVTQRKRARPLLIAVIASAVYGGWAALAHIRLGASVALHAGLTQAALSAVTTLGLVLLLERLFHWASNPVRGFWLASLGASTLAITWLAGGHALAGTPHIAVAIAPSAIVGVACCFAYARTLLVRARAGNS